MKNPETSLKAAKAAAAVKERIILKFLNSVKKPEEIAEMLETAGNRESAMAAARKILNYRTKNGRFKSLKEVGSIPQLGKEKFPSLVSRLSDIETTLTPAMTAPSFSVDGQVRDSLSSGVIEFSIEECETHAPRCEATFANWDPTSPNPGFLWSDRSVLDFGKTLTIQARSGALPMEIFKGYITGTKADYPGDGLPGVTITAVNRYEAQMKITRRTRTFENVSDSDVIRQIANEQGMQADMDDQGVWHEVLVQAGHNDLEFIRERARAIGAEFRVDGNTLRVRSLHNVVRPSMSFTYGRQLTAFSARAEVDDQVTSVTAFAWDPVSKDVLSYKADETTTTEEPGEGQSGSSILRETLTGADDKIAQAGAADEELRGLAQTRYREAAHRFVRGSGVVTGYTGLRVGNKVTLNGLGTMFSGSYRVNKVKLTYTPGNGYSTRFDVERSWVNPS